MLHVPKNRRKNASQLLKQLELRSSEISFDSSGLVLIDGVGLPGSNIFLLFPFLFKKEKPSLPGLEEFLNKLREMKLQEYFLDNVPKKKKKLKRPLEEISVKHHKIKSGII